MIICNSTALTIAPKEAKYCIFVQQVQVY